MKYEASKRIQSEGIGSSGLFENKQKGVNVVVTEDKRPTSIRNTKDTEHLDLTENPRP